MAKRSKAHFVEPMLLLRTECLAEGADSGFTKLRAVRSPGAGLLKAEAKLNCDHATTTISALRYASVTQALEAMPDETVIDGEVVALDTEGKPSFHLLQLQVVAWASDFLCF